MRMEKCISPRPATLKLSLFSISETRRDTSFIVSLSQGIHHRPLLRFSHNPILKDCQKPEKFIIDDYVLTWRKRNDKLCLEWRGPYRIVGIESKYIYQIGNILTNEITRAHANTLHNFIVGNLTPTQLKFVATEQDEYIIEKVIGHKGSGKNLEFNIKYLGFEQAPINHPDAWTTWKYCRFSPIVKQYCDIWKLKPQLH